MAEIIVILKEIEREEEYMYADEFQYTYDYDRIYG